MQAIQAPRPGPGHFGARSLAASRAIGAPALRAAAATGAAGEPHCDRRAVLAALATSLVGCPGRDARAGEEAVAGGPPAAAPPAAAAPPPTTTLLGERLDGPENFSIFAPLGYDLVLLAAAPGAAVSDRERGERGRGVAPSSSPVKVRYLSPAGDAELTVIVREAASIKPTFLQVADLAQWGDLATVAGLLLPRGVRVLASAAQVLNLPDRDTGTLAGVVPTPPQTVYRYEFEGRDGVRATLAAVARAGRVFLVAGSARAAAWPSQAAILRAAVSSFRLAPPAPAGR